MKKEDIRRRIKAQKALLTEREKQDAATAVFRALEQTAAFMVSERILMYLSLPDELSTREFIDKWAPKKQFYLPRVNGLNLEILPYDRSKLRLGAFRIEEPEGNETVSVSEIDMIVVPAVGYDTEGRRVGRGKGYYDKLLARTKAIKVGVAYQFQVVDYIETEPHDISVDMVITDRNIYYAPKTKKH